MRERARRSEEPRDRLTSMASEMLVKLNLMNGGHVQAVVMLREGECDGTAYQNFDSDAAATAFLIAHVATILEANGKTLAITTLGQG